MEDLTPPLLRAVQEVKMVLRSGKSMNEAFQTYLNQNHDEFAADLRQLWFLRNRASLQTTLSLPTYLQRAFWQLIERGLDGEPTIDELSRLEDEIQQAAEMEIEDHLSSLPFKTLIPLLLFQFPAYLLLLLGPLLRQLRHHLGG